MPEKIKRCPLCGGKPSMQPVQIGDKSKVVISCQNCGIAAIGVGRECVNKWNNFYNLLPQHIHNDEQWIFAGFVFYPKERYVRLNNGTEISFSDKENKALKALLENVNHLVERKDLQKLLWQEEGEPLPKRPGNLIEIYMHNLRRKMRSLLTIQTIRGKGYVATVMNSSI